jgi:hypothetical protein
VEAEAAAETTGEGGDELVDRVGGPFLLFVSQAQQDFDIYCLFLGDLFYCNTKMIELGELHFFSELARVEDV